MPKKIGDMLLQDLCSTTQMAYWKQIIPEEKYIELSLKNNLKQTKGIEG